MASHAVMTARGRHVSGRVRRGGRRAVKALGAGLAVLLVLGLVGGGVAWWQLEGNIDSTDVSGLLGDDRPEQVEARPGEGEPPMNVLLVGSDTRDFDGGDAFGGTEATPGLSDTTILLHLSAGRESATLVSLPRDLVVDIPSCETPGGGTTDPRRGQFNSAYATGGVACTIRTVEAITGVFVDHYVVVDFAGFQRMVDAVGGVEVCLEEPARDELSGLDLPAGRQVVEGDQALAFVRARYALGNGGDLSRIERQQAFLGSMVQKVTSTGVLLRPDRLYSLLDAATESMTTDPGLASLNELRKIAQSLRALPPEEVRFVTAPNEPLPSNPNRLQLTPAADDLWQALRTDSPLPGAEPAEPTAPPTTDPLSATPDRVAVRVLNAGAPAGSARAATEALQVQGFAVEPPGDSDDPVDGVVVVRGPQQSEEARTLAAAFPGAKVRMDPLQSGPLLVLVGEGAPEVVEVPNRLGTEPVPSAEPTPTPTLDVRQATDDICS